MMRETMQVRSGSAREFAHGLVRVADGKEDLARLLRVAEDRHRGDGFKRGRGLRRRGKAQRQQHRVARDLLLLVRVLDRDAARERIAVDAHELRRGAEIHVRARHVVAHEHVVHLEARLRRDGLGHVDARHVLAPHVHLQRRLDADESAADHDDALAHITAVAQGLGRKVHLRAVESRDGLRRDGPAAGRPEDVVRRIGRGELRRRRGVKAHGDVVHEELALEVADHAVHVALEKRLAGAQSVAADVAARLPDLDRMAGLFGIERRHAAGRAGADDEDLTLYCIQHGFFEGEKIKEEELKASIHDIDISFRLNAETGRPDTYLNGVNVEKEIRGMEVADKVSPVATLGFVRRALVAKQQEMGKAKGIVMDGRDIGTVVFPDAELKLFVTASPEVRAKRRVDELEAKGIPASYEEVLENVKKRDYIDSTREESPLRQADDALVLDNSHMTLEEQKAWLLEQYHKAIGS